MKWPDETRAAALKVYAAEGLAAAHRTTKVPKSTIRLWARKQGLSAPSAPTPGDPEHLASELARLINIGLTRVEAELKAGRGRTSASAARHAAVATAVLVDKLDQLNRGGRSPSPGAQRGALDKLITEGQANVARVFERQPARANGQPAPDDDLDDAEGEDPELPDLPPFLPRHREVIW